MPSAMVQQLAAHLSSSRWEEADALIAEYPSVLRRRPEALKGHTLLEHFAGLDVAPAAQQMAVYAFLLDRGCDWRNRNTAFCREGGYLPDFLITKGAASLFKLLHEKAGPDVLEVKSEEGCLLHMAIRYRSPEIFLYLLEQAPHLLQKVNDHHRTPEQVIDHIVSLSGMGISSLKDSQAAHLKQLLVSWRAATAARAFLAERDAPDPRPAGVAP